MSLWTPSGEHPVDRPGGEAARQQPDRAEQPPPSDAASAAPDLSDLSPEERAQAEEFARQMDEARRQLLEMPAGPVVGQQALQFYELAALHLAQPEPRLDDARIAIDALRAVVEALGSRLGEAEAPLRQAVNQLQLAYVEASGSKPPPTAS
jgi:hypothetical protein